MSIERSAPHDSGRCTQHSTEYCKTARFTEGWSGSGVRTRDSGAHRPGLFPPPPRNPGYTRWIRRLPPREAGFATDFRAAFHVRRSLAFGLFLARTCRRLVRLSRAAGSVYILFRPYHRHQAVFIGDLRPDRLCHVPVVAPLPGQLPVRLGDPGNDREQHHSVPRHHRPSILIVGSADAPGGALDSNR